MPLHMTEEARQTWWQRRLDDLSRTIADGEYFVSAEEIAAAILFGRPKWGDDPELVDEPWLTEEYPASAGRF